jgi:hypothetical protein
MNASVLTKGNLYDVNSYTDKELYDILDLVNPTDRELEAKILTMVNKYTRMAGNMSADMLAQFFIDIYARFFELSEDESEMDEREGFAVLGDTGKQNASYADSSEYPNYGNSQYEAYGNTPGTNLQVMNRNIYANGERISGEEYDVGSNVAYSTQNQEYIGNTQIKDVAGNVIKQYGTPKITKTYNTPKIERKGMLDITQNDRSKDNTQLTKPVDYTRDVFTPINPLLKQTIKRVISIDSQYRDNKKTSSTEFTFNLSEPLRDVVSLKLYSVQIPYTWYTINSNYGGNFFFIKGNGPIDNDSHYYQIQVKSGNYTAGTLITAIKQSISQLPNKYPDVSFGATDIIYTESSVKTTLSIDTKEVFGESNYYLEFPSLSADMGNAVNRLDSLAGYLGLNNRRYECCSVYSASIDAFNNSFLNPIALTDSSINIITYTDDINVPSQRKTIYIDNATGITSYTELIAHINQSIQKCDFLDVVKSQIVLENQPTGSQNLYYIKCILKLRRWALLHTENIKVAVTFPDDHRIWTGNDSLFRFKKGPNIISDIEAETVNLPTKYKITEGTQIRFQCIKQGFGNVRNDYILPLPVTTSTYGIDLSGYIGEMNKAFVSVDASYASINANIAYAYHPFIIGNNSISNVYLDNSNKLNFRVGVQKVFNNSDYIVQFMGNNTLTRLGFPNESQYNLSDQNVFYSNLNSPGILQFVSGVDKIKFIPRDNNLNGSAERYDIDLSGSTVDLSGVTKVFKDAFDNYRDINDENPFSRVNVSLITDDRRIKIDIQINKTLHTQDYKMILTGNATNSNGNITSENAWRKYFSFVGDGGNALSPTVEYSLNNQATNGNMVIIQNANIIRPNKIKLNNSNNYFYIKPLYSPNNDGLDDILITLSESGEYTVDEIYQQINNAFRENTITEKSSVDFLLVNNDNDTKTLFKIDVNKVYTTKDYRVVFYDPYSFVTCYTGATRSAGRYAQNTTWDTTLGWVLGFRENIEYDLSQYIGIQAADIATNTNDALSSLNYYDGTKCVLISDTTVSTNLYNYFLIVLDDYTQNHLNDGLVTITTQETTIDIGRYKYVCDPYSPNSSELIAVPADDDYTKLSQRELYAFNQKVLSKKVKEKSYSKGPFVKDIFGIIPIKTSGLSPGSIYVEFGGTLQNQERMYFGPVNIHRMTIRLLNDRGDFVDLNNANWSFSLVCEQLYRNNV